MAIKWKLHTKGTHAGKYRKYKDINAVICTSRGVLLLSPAIMELLGRPGRVLLYNDGKGLMGIAEAAKDDPFAESSYSVSFNSKADPKTAFGQVSCVSYTKKHKMTSGAYVDMEMENNVLVINIKKCQILQVHN